MEGCAASLPHAKMLVHSSCVSTGSFAPHSQLLRLQRTSCHVVRGAQLSSWNHCGISPSYFTNPISNPYPRSRSIRFYCVGTFLNPDVAATFEWVPVVDQALLIASIFLAHIAGIIPARKSISSSQNCTVDDYTISEGSTLPELLQRMGN